MGAQEWVLLSAALVAIGGVCVWLVREYARPSTPAYVQLLVGTAWFLGFAGLALLPIDLTLAKSSNHELLVQLWTWLYWSTFVMAWLVLPVASEMEKSGEKHWWSRLGSGVWACLMGYVWVGAGAVVVALWLVASGRFTASQLLSSTLTAADAYGQLLVAVLAGYGFSLLPMSVFHAGDPGRQATLAKAEAWAVCQDWEAARDELAQLQRDVRYAASVVQEAGEGEAQQLVDEASQLVAHSPVVSDGMSMLSSSHVVLAGRQLITMPDGCIAVVGGNVAVEGGVAAVSRGGREGASQQQQQQQQRAQVSVSTVFTRRDAVELLARARLLDGRVGQIVDHWAQLVSSTAKLPATTSVGWRVLAGAGGVVAGIASMALLLSEAVLPAHFVPHDGNLSVVSRLVGSASSTVARGVLTSVPLFWLCACLFFGLFSVRPLRALALHRKQLTNAPALLLNAVYACRIQFSLGVNFLLLTAPTCASPAGLFSAAGSSSCALKPATQTAFATAFAPSVEAPAVDLLVPMLSVFVGLFTLFNVLDSLLRCLGIPELSFTDQDNLRLGTRALEIGSRPVRRPKEVVRVGGDPEDEVLPPPAKPWKRNRATCHWVRL
jgi:hypothetical protein